MTQTQVSHFSAEQSDNYRIGRNTKSSNRNLTLH